MSAPALLREAAEAGVNLRLVEGRPKMSGAPSPDLLARLRAHKEELTQILAGDRCRRCGERMRWPEPDGVVYADGAAEHHACRIWAANERALNSPDALADEAEVMLRGELP